VHWTQLLRLWLGGGIAAAGCDASQSFAEAMTSPHVTLAFSGLPRSARPFHMAPAKALPLATLASESTIYYVSSRPTLSNVRRGLPKVDHPEVPLQIIYIDKSVVDNSLHLISEFTISINTYALHHLAPQLSPLDIVDFF